LAAPENLAVADSRKIAHMGDLLLLLQKAQKRYSHAERPAQSGSDV
jgi:hypothetical protein